MSWRRYSPGGWLWSVGRRNLAEFRRSDFLGPAATPLKDAVRDCVVRATGVRPAGPVRLLTHLRYAGYSFNPVSFYYCFGADAVTLEHVVAEITNTPWQERHAYVLSSSGAQRRGGALQWTFAKAFHVSPFMPMERGYHGSSAHRARTCTCTWMYCATVSVNSMRRSPCSGVHSTRAPCAACCGAIRS